MAGLYRELLRALIPLSPRVGEGLREHLESLAAERAAQRECIRLETQLNGESQFNRKVELNRLLREARHVLKMTRAVAPGRPRWLLRHAANHQHRTVQSSVSIIGNQTLLK